MDCKQKEDYIISPQEAITRVPAVGGSRTPAIIGINRPVNEVVILPLERRRWKWEAWAKVFSSVQYGVAAPLSPPPPVRSESGPREGREDARGKPWMAAL